MVRLIFPEYITKSFWFWVLNTYPEINIGEYKDNFVKLVRDSESDLFDSVKEIWYIFINADYMIVQPVYADYVDKIFPYYYRAHRIDSSMNSKEEYITYIAFVPRIVWEWK